jgi:hypothetical protein
VMRADVEGLRRELGLLPAGITPSGPFVSAAAAGPAN